MKTKNKSLLLIIINIYNIFLNIVIEYVNNIIIEYIKKSTVLIVFEVN